MATPTVSVKISKRQHKELLRIRLANGPTVTWQVAYAIDLYLQEINSNIQEVGKSTDERKNGGK